ncbi:hypothetical protein [Streptomyces sp. NBC_01207]|uniref:hypothetical protein n=1 Tax=Streptomyces sp. NBC_01207 TaxID=2903772 RepID=UPI002E102EEE|nr:hypothetical protein OG457_49045 [Streptomyces sp. NBC_01207]
MPAPAAPARAVTASAAPAPAATSAAAPAPAAGGSAAGFPIGTWLAAMRQVRRHDLPAPYPAPLAAAPVPPPGPNTWRTLLPRLLARILAGLGRTR